MEEKREIKVRLSTVVYLFIILVLLVSLGVVYYLGFVKDDNTNNMLADEETTEINENKTGTNQMKLGKHYIQSNETPLDDELNTIDCDISFLENNKFNAYIGWGNSVSGTYTIIVNNIVKCLINSAKGEYSPEQDTYAEISFKINSNSEIEVIGASETYMIKLTDLDENGNYIITNEDKKMPLEITKGIKYILDENVYEQNLKEDNEKEVISKIAEEDKRFVINDIVKNGDKYTVSAYILEEETRKISEQEYKNILKGQEMTFRNIKWKYDKNASEEDVVYLKAVGNYNNMSYTPELSLVYDDNKKVAYVSNVAGIGVNLCDYSEEINFQVSSDIKVCAYWGEFYRINGKLICRNIENIEIETEPESIEYLINFCNNNEPGTCGSYEECIAYVSNGNIDGIKILDK